ncbi:MAG: ferrous iron transport protein A [Tissierellia bacterium]|nr:ferrous iron transport protein A [Tissierellia bacterium]
MTLYNLNKEDRCTIISIPNVMLLESLGIRKGLSIKIKNKQPLGGPIILQLGTRSIAIGKAIAKQILVEV